MVPKLDHESSSAPEPVEEVQVSPVDIANALSVVTGKQDVSFQSEAQELAIKEAVVRQNDLLVVLPTGGGKSAVYMVPAVLELGKLHIVIVPLLSLLVDLVRRCEDAGISATIWHEGLNVSSGILFVQVEKAASNGFIQYLMVNKDKIARFVYDECHLFVTQKQFRPAMNQAAQLRAQVNIAVPTILLSATVPLQMEEDLQDHFQMRVKIVRMSTMRHNLRYVVNIVDTDTRVNEVLYSSLISDNLLKNSALARAIVYCRSRERCETVSDFLNKQSEQSISSFYHANMTQVEREQGFKNWASGKTKIMVATSAFGAGIDYPNVVKVIHIDPAHSLVDYAQECGRAGRTGMYSICETITSSQALGFIWSCEDTDTYQREVLDLLQSSTCRRKKLQTYLDGSGETCLMISGVGRCDVCARQAQQQVCNEQHSNVENLYLAFSFAEQSFWSCWVFILCCSGSNSTTGKQSTK